MNEEAINVNLYGSGSRDCRLRAEYIFCNRANECSAYKQGTCFAVTVPFSRHCMVGSVSRVDGGTKRSKMYNKVRETAKAHPNYSILNFPFNEKLVRIGNDALVVLRYPCTFFTKPDAFLLELLRPLV